MNYTNISNWKGKADMPSMTPMQQGFSNMFKMGSPSKDDIYRNAVIGGIQESNRFAQEMAAEKQREFEQSSAREAMSFEAEQAALNRDFQTASARDAMAFESEQASINRDWQEHMSNTAYQRAVQDLQAAGLNPALAYQQGGAATTSGATASGHAAGGSSASGFKASGSKADVDTTTTKDLISLFVNAALDFYKSSVSAISEIIPF